MKHFLFCLFISFGLGFNVAAQASQQEADSTDLPTQTENDSAMSEQEAMWLAILEQWKSMEKQTGEITIADGAANISVPDNYFFLGAQDANTVLVDFWGNPPGSPVLGMLFPADTTPFDENGWAVTVEYEQDGYVSDEDADSIDYSELLSEMQSSTREESKERIAQGYEPIELVGWAKAPYYDQASHKLHWAKELKFGEMEENTLNYNIRVLGRKGVLVLNFIAGMSQLDEINSQLEQVVAMANFNQGSKYADFDPSVDEMAAYGVGALVAGKVLAKTGFLAALLLFLKKFGIYILIGLAWLSKKLFFNKKEAS